MMKRKALLTLMAASMLTIGGGTLIHAAFDENLNMYTLDAVVVEADKTKNKFGDTITEQSYYRTGGDVKVITREEIEKRHYTDVTEAIKRIPGVTFQNPGYRGGEYGFQFFNNGVSINGDSRVIILVDGRRVDNAASTRVSSRGASTTAGNGTGTNLDQVTNIENIDKIEVIKGPGASAYGSDATGGVINIITRKGGQEPVGTIDLATGSWKKHNYAISYSGSAGDDNSWHYFISANRNMSGDSKYVDGGVDKEGTLGGSRWKEDGVNLRVDKDFDENHGIKVWYNHKSGKDGYPIMTPLLKTFNEEGWQKMIFSTVVGELDTNNKFLEYKGKPKDYRNIFSLDSTAYGSYNQFINNDWDITYTFNKENGMESFIRFYDQNHKYSTYDEFWWGYLNGIGYKSNREKNKDLANDYMSQFPNGASAEQLKQWMDEHLAPFPGGDKEKLNEWVNKTKKGQDKTWMIEKNRGIQLQYAKSLGIHDLIGNVTYDRSRVYTKKTGSDASTSHVQRKTVQSYLQDKIHITDKWDFTPSLRYTWYSSFNHHNADGKNTDRGDSASNLSYALNTEYMFNDTTSMYAGWTRVFRPIKESDYLATNGPKDTKVDAQLEDEKGNVWTLGIRKELSDKTTLNVNYDWAKMSNAVTSVSVANTTTGTTGTGYLNAKENRKAFNITVDSQVNDHITISASYDHMKDKWTSKGIVLPTGWEMVFNAPIDLQINRMRPENHYALNIAYDNAKLYSGLLINWYTGNDANAFSHKRFLIVDWNINYQLQKDVSLYMTATNLFNKAYETSYSNTYGYASLPGRCVMVGAKYTF